VALRQESTRLHDDVDLDRDRLLVERCQAGDSSAFANLYARYYERLLRFCLRRLGDRHEAEDAAQEAFAKAWKALPHFAGERHFYPWLTVIAGNVCTDTLRRRSRSTPTADTELSARLPVGADQSATADEVVIAGVDGELVHRALDRLSSRHREVLAMREGSGWTYQQIADHEGVEIGTIETLLWRARQALKREFNVLAEAKGTLAGFVVGAGALIRTGYVRAAHRGAALTGAGASAPVRNAFAGVAVTSAAVAAAFIAPHALGGAHGEQIALRAPTSVQAMGTSTARNPLRPGPAATPGHPGATSVAVTETGTSTGTGALGTGSSGSPGGAPATPGVPPAAAAGGTAPPQGGNPLAPLAVGVSGALPQEAVGNVVASTVSGLGQTLASTPSSTGIPTSPTTTATTTLPSIVAPITNTVTSTVHELLGG